MASLTSAALHFALNYTQMFEHYLFQDRDIDSNLIFCISYMVFGNGAACVYATTQGKLFETVLDVANAWYNNQVVDQHLVIHLADRKASRLNTETPAFRSKKGITVFGHLRALFRHAEMQRLVVETPMKLSRIVTFLNQFVGLQTQRKEHGEHIEYEVDWPRSFAILGELAKCSREVGESFQYARPVHLLRIMSMVSNAILNDMMLLSQVLDPEKYAPPVEAEVQDVLVSGSRFALLKENISNIKAFSFHHYMHLLLAEMMKAAPNVINLNIAPYRDKDLRAIFEEFVLKSPFTGDRERMKLMLLEYPLQSELRLSDDADDRTRRSLADPSRHVEKERRSHARSVSPLP